MAFDIFGLSSSKTNEKTSSQPSDVFGISSPKQEPVQVKTPIKTSVLPKTPNFTGSKTNVGDVIAGKRENIISGGNDLLKGVIQPVVREGTSLVTGGKKAISDIFGIVNTPTTGTVGEVGGKIKSIFSPKKIFDTVTGTEFTPTTETQKNILGTDKPFSLRSTGQEVADIFGIDLKNKPAIAGGLGIVSSVLDFSGFGGEKNASKALLTAKTAEEAVGHLKSIGISEKAADAAGNALVNFRKEEDKQKFIDGLLSRKENTSNLEGINPKQETKITPEEAGPLSDKASEDYWNRVIEPNKEKGITVGGDDLKDFYGKDYNDNNHPVYSQASGKIFTRALKESPEDTVIFTGGGPASGKTELITKAIRDKGFKGIIYDSNLSNYEGTVKQIEQARAAGKNVEISGVLPDIDKARTFSLQREARTGRGISDATFARGHAGFPAVVKKLIEDGKILPEDVHLLDTRGTSSFEEAIRKVANEDYVKNPLDAVSNMEHNEDNLKQLYGKQNYNRETGARETELPVRGGSSDTPSEHRTNQGDAIRKTDEGILGETNEGKSGTGKYTKELTEEQLIRRDEIAARLSKNANDPQAIKDLDALTHEVNTNGKTPSRNEMFMRSRATALGFEKNEKGEYIKKPKEYTEKSKKMVDESSKKARTDYTKDQAKISLDNSLSSNIIQTPMERVGYIGKMRQLLGPAKALDTETQSMFRTWDSKLKKAKVLANKELETGLKIPIQEAGKVIDDYEMGKPTEYAPKIKAKFDALFNEAKARGIETNHLPNYVPHVYKQSGAEISKMMHQFLMDNGMTSDEAKAYMNGKKLSPDNVRRLGLNPFFVKDRTFPTYAAAREYGLTPKYHDVDQLIAHYREYLERNVANKEFLEGLVKSGRLRLPEYSPSNWKAVELSFSPKGYYAEPNLASTLNALFRNEDALSFGEMTTKFMANLSKKAQEITLSAGLPNSNFNFFSMGQTIKQMTAGDFGAVKPFLRANFNGPSIKFFKENQKVMEQMSEEGIDLGSTVASYENVYKNLAKEWSPKKIKEGGFKGFASLAGETFDKMFNEKTFGSFMPQMHIQYFKKIYEGGLEKGMSTAQAQKLAGEVTKKMFGMVDDVGRSQATKDFMSAVLFAPHFREGIIQTLINTGKAGTDILKSFMFRKPLDPTLAGNRKLLGGMILTYGLYNALNKKLNGNYMWENPDNRKFALRVPYNDGKDAVYVEFMPSFLAFARNMAQGALSIGEGDFKNATQKFGSLLSMPLKSITELVSNSDYFGRPIYKENSTGVEKLKALGKYLFLNYNHPYVGEAYKSLVEDKQPLWQALVKMAELPVKFATKASESRNEYYKAIDEMTKRRTEERQKFKDTIYADIQKVKDSGDVEKAQKMVDELSDVQYDAYKEVRASEKRADTIKRETAMYPVYQKVQALVKKGDTPSAEAIVKGLSDDDYEAYSKLRDKLKK